MEECVEKEDDVGLDGDTVEEDRERLGLIERIGHESGLDHDQGVVDIFFVENMTGRTC